MSEYDILCHIYFWSLCIKVNDGYDLLYTLLSRTKTISSHSTQLALSLTPSGLSRSGQLFMMGSHCITFLVYFQAERQFYHRHIFSRLLSRVLNCWNRFLIISRAFYVTYYVSFLLINELKLSWKWIFFSIDGLNERPFRNLSVDLLK